MKVEENKFIVVGCDDFFKYCLQTVPSNALPRVPAGSRNIPPQGVLLIEQFADKLSKQDLPTRATTTRRPYEDIRRPLDKPDAEVFICCLICILKNKT